MILVTTGSQEFQFNRLLRAVDDLVASGKINENVFAQTGASDYIPKNYDYQNFLPKSELDQKMKEADIIITHAGTGIIMNALAIGKKVIGVPRLEKYGEHVDNHQVQIIEELTKEGLIEPCYDEKNLKTALDLVMRKEYKKYTKDGDNLIINDILEYIMEDVSK